MIRLLRTILLIIFALKPRRLGAALPPDAARAASEGYGQNEELSCEPQAIAGGMGRLANRRGELRLFFPYCLAIAAPALLFRLKREGFSACTVRAAKRGLLVQGTR